MDLDVTGALGPERAALLDLLGSLAPDEWELPTECPAWTVKGLALHILGDDLSLLSRQRDAVPTGLLLYASQHPGLSFRQLLDGFNEQWVTAASFFSPALVVELLRCSGEWTEAFYRSVDLHELNEPVGFFAAKGPSPYWQLIAREYIERWLHQHQLRRAVGRPDLGPEHLATAAMVAVRSMAAHLARVDAPAGTVIDIEVPTVSHWTLHRADDGWVMRHDADAPAAVRFTVPAERATTLWSRGYVAADVRDAIHVDGDAGLADRVLSFIELALGRDKV